MSDNERAGLQEGGVPLKTPLATVLFELLDMIEGRTHPPAKFVLGADNFWELTSLGAHLGVFLTKLTSSNADVRAQPGESLTVAPSAGAVTLLQHRHDIPHAIRSLGANGHIVNQASARDARKLAKLLPELKLGEDVFLIPLKARLEAPLLPFVGALIAAGVLERRGGADVFDHFSPINYTALDAWVASRKGITYEALSQGANPRRRVLPPSYAEPCPRCGPAAGSRDRWGVRIPAKKCALCNPTGVADGWYT